MSDRMSPQEATEDKVRARAQGAAPPALSPGWWGAEHLRQGQQLSFLQAVLVQTGQPEGQRCEPQAAAWLRLKS